MTDSQLPILLHEEIMKLEISVQKLSENNQRYLLTFPDEISKGLRYTLKKDSVFFCAYCTYTAQLQDLLAIADNHALKISTIIQQADQAVQIKTVDRADRILCSYHILRQSVASLLEDTQQLLADPDETVSGSKLLGYVRSFQYKLQQFSDLLSGCAIK